MAYFFVAWVFGALAVALATIDDGFMAFAVIAGPLMIAAGIRIFRDPNDPWNRIMAGMPASGRMWLPGDGLAIRAFGAGAFVLIGTGFFVGGVLGVLAIFGAYDFPSQ